jgi:hypothetical protein
MYTNRTSDNDSATGNLGQLKGLPLRRCSYGIDNLSY